MTWVVPTNASPPMGSIVLMVDDNAADVDLTREALIGSPLVAELHAVADGIEALGFLRREGAYCRAPVPNLVLLDLNMPRLDGRGVLAEMKGDPSLSNIPVIVFSSSSAQADVADAYRLRANCYVLKPVMLDDFLETIHAIEQFWIGLVALPSRPSDTA